MPPRLSLCVVFPPCQESKALALRALHLIAGTFYYASFLLRHEWNWSFHPVVRGRLARIFAQVAFLAHYRRTLHS